MMEDITEKVLQIKATNYDAIEVNYSKNLSMTVERPQKETICIIECLFLEISFGLCFRAALFKLFLYYIKICCSIESHKCEGSTFTTFDIVLRMHLWHGAFS